MIRNHVSGKGVEVYFFQESVPFKDHSGFFLPRFIMQVLYNNRLIQEFSFLKSGNLFRDQNKAECYGSRIGRMFSSNGVDCIKTHYDERADLGDCVSEDVSDVRYMIKDFYVSLVRGLNVTD